MSFWQLSTGELPTGLAKDAYTSSFDVIPDGTKALARIEKFVLDESGKDPVFQITWKITSEEFKGRLVFHKIRCFDEKPSKADKAKNMLKLVMILCNYKPTHHNAPTDDELRTMCGNICGIKILEYPPKEGNKGGNYIGEVHKADGFVTEIGVKSVQVGRPSAVESAFSRNAAPQVAEDDIPF